MVVFLPILRLAAVFLLFAALTGGAQAQGQLADQAISTAGDRLGSRYRRWE